MGEKSVTEILLGAQEAAERLRGKYQKQIDMDGVMVGVSRQAVDQLLAAYDAALTASKPTGEGHTYITDEAGNRGYIIP